MSDSYLIMDIAGILYHKDIPLIDFEISGTSLRKAIDISKGKYHPFEFRMLGLTYEAFNIFFNERVVPRTAMDIWEYLHFLGLKHYDFNEMIKKMNGWDALGTLWVRFPNIGAKCWDDIWTQKYPIY